MINLSLVDNHDERKGSATTRPRLDLFFYANRWCSPRLFAGQIFAPSFDTQKSTPSWPLVESPVQMKPPLPSRTEDGDNKTGTKKRQKRKRQRSRAI
ncbi:hypothetical protein pclt_cds_371 [Pandoravirus celtis]|uniref:Uncharacterized protein n=1 Tax=Pandoravirus celtis TaxID=2568002 RepID=A0A4D6EGL2_9VIRU|nr:hypothetical protein pclt_cds_371 [Pandoravirus celtis]